MLGDKTPRVESKFKYHVRYTLSEIFRAVLQIATDVGEIARDLRAIKAEMFDLMERLNRIESLLTPGIIMQKPGPIRKDSWVHRVKAGDLEPIVTLTAKIGG